MNDCLSLPLRQGTGGTRQLAGWEATFLALGEGEAQGLPAGQGKGWKAIEVPGQLAATEGRQAVWYRTSFPRPDHPGRVLLRIGGAFLAANVWLNGKLLGSHYGYFAAFGFDITSHLRAENLLVICCESPVEQDLARKRHVMGWFNDGDSRPYPASAYFSLPEPYEWEVPLGLWRPVELEYLGAVALDWVRFKPRQEAGTGRLEVECRLRNLDAREMSGEIGIEVGAGEARPLRLRREFKLSGALEQTLSMTLSLPEVRRWWPWSLGEQSMYSATTTVSVGDRESSRVEERFGFRETEVRAGHEGWTVSVNGVRMFLRGANYQPGLRLDHLTEAVFREDLRIAREANLDALRVHAHVLPEEFYRLADEAGMLVVADLPLTLSYAYHAGLEDARFFETAVREQVPEMVELLRNRPSVLMWGGHDDPPWIASNAELADVHAVRQNYTIDQELRELAQELDPTRTALAASGETDSHLYLGWRQGPWTGFAEVNPGLVTEFGAQALPSLDSPVWEELGRRWPVADDDPAWLHAGFQPGAWAEHGVGLPSEFESLDEYVTAGQEYQAALLIYAIDQFRKRKFELCQGAFVFQLVDSFPGIGFGLVDSERRPRLALKSVAEAMAASRLIVEPTGFEPIWPFGFAYRPGSAAGFRLIVVNDDRALSGDASVRWSLWRDRGPERVGIARLRELVRRQSFSGSADFELPSAGEPAVQVAALSLPLELEGDYRLEAELLVRGRVLQRTGIDVLVSPDPQPPRLRRPIPGYLAERIVERTSLEADGRGVRFTLLNRTRPAVLVALSDLRLDGRPLTGRLLIEGQSGWVSMPKRVELPVGRPLRILIEQEQDLEGGAHELEMDLTLPGVASGRLTVRSRPGPRP